MLPLFCEWQLHYHGIHGPPVVLLSLSILDFQLKEKSKLHAQRSTGLSPHRPGNSPTPHSALPWPHTIMSAMNRSDSWLGAHGVSADRFKPERKEPYHEGWAGMIYSLYLHHPHCQEMAIYWPLGPDPTRCWVPYGKLRATSFCTPPKSAVFNFIFSMKNTASIID